MSHTPGPWVEDYEYTDYGTRVRVIRTARYENVIGECGIERDDDASLIAAAPDLLAALIDVRDNALSDSPDMWGRIDAAIAKATGESR